MLLYAWKVQFLKVQNTDASICKKTSWNQSQLRMHDAKKALAFIWPKKGFRNKIPRGLQSKEKRKKSRKSLLSPALLLGTNSSFLCARYIDITRRKIGKELTCPAYILYQLFKQHHAIDHCTALITVSHNRHVMHICINNKLSVNWSVIGD
jgi:hypothetical protein